MMAVLIGDYKGKEGRRILYALDIAGRDAFCCRIPTHQSHPEPATADLNLQDSAIWPRTLHLLRSAQDICCWLGNYIIPRRIAIL